MRKSQELAWDSVSESRLCPGLRGGREGARREGIPAKRHDVREGQLGRGAWAGPHDAGRWQPCWSGRPGPSGSVFLLSLRCFCAEFPVCHCFSVILF